MNPINNNETEKYIEIDNTVLDNVVKGNFNTVMRLLGLILVAEWSFSIQSIHILIKL